MMARFALRQAVAEPLTAAGVERARRRRGDEKPPWPLVSIKALVLFLRLVRQLFGEWRGRRASLVLPQTSGVPVEVDAPGRAYLPVPGHDRVPRPQRGLPREM